VRPFLIPDLKITSGEIIVKEAQGRAEAEQLNSVNQKRLRQSAHQDTFNRFKIYSSKNQQ